MLLQHPKYNHLFLSQDGQIYSTKSNKYLSLFLHKHGYFILSTKLNGRLAKGSTFKVHRLMAETYLPNPNNYPVVNHKNGNKQDNRVCNLEWCTSRQNALHSYKLGLSKPQNKEQNAMWKGTKDKIEEARVLREQGLSLRKIGALLGVSKNAINRWLSP